MTVLHIDWNKHDGFWPPVNSGRRWSGKELDELKTQLNRLGLNQVSDAIGSLQFDIINLKNN